ncbi:MULTISPECIES: hypothetical protein [unclassified Micromonospora]|uniref:hypothetical protein n=1 Tax=unclassified Micromonospora TaxID=2617518 RepID=UPI002FF34749
MDRLDAKTVDNPDWELQPLYQASKKFEEKVEPIVGATDIYNCGEQLDKESCAWAAAAALPFGAGRAGRTLAMGSSATKGSRPLIIGENMKRVKEYAKQVDGHAYRPWKNDPFDFALGMRRNERMIKDAMRSGREIIDIGPDFARRAAGRAPSPFYNMERRVTSTYANYTKVFERFGKLDGGVPGLDF